VGDFLENWVVVLDKTSILKTTPRAANKLTQMLISFVVSLWFQGTKSNPERCRVVHELVRP